MAQLLVCSVPNPGHVSPMLAVSRHLAHAGHTILFHTAEPFRERVEKCGLTFLPTRGKANYDYRRPDEFFPERRSLAPGPETMNGGCAATFCRPLADQHKGLQEILRTHSIDLILIDTVFFGALPLLLGSAADRPPVLCCGVNPMLLTGADAGPEAPRAKTAAGRRAAQQSNRNFIEMFRPFTARLNEELQKLGCASISGSPFDVFYTLPDRVLQFNIPEFEFVPSDTPSTVRLVGSLLPQASESFTEPVWWKDLEGGRPVVVVTQGTLANIDLSELISPTLSALSREDVLVIAATGRMDAAISGLPQNARVTHFIPFDRLLPKSSVLVTNGGFGAVTQALAAGVPLVTAGETEDKSWVSKRVGWSGAGINLGTGRPGEAMIRSALLEILANPSYRQAAARIAQTMQRYDALQAVAEEVNSLLFDKVPAAVFSAASYSSAESQSQ